MATAAPARRKGTGRVKAPRKHVEPLEDTLSRLMLAIGQIHSHNASQLSFEEHYRYAYSLVLYKQGHTLYNSVADLISAHLERETARAIVPSFPPSSSLPSGSGSNIASAAAGQLFLENVRDVWDDHVACMSKLRDVLKYMDKVYTGSISLPVVWDLGLSLFLHHVVLFSTNPKPKPVAPTRASAASTPKLPLPTTDSATVAHHLIATLLSQIRIEREGEPVSRSTLRSTLEMLCELTDEGPIPLPITASTGTGSGNPVMGVGSGGGNLRGRPVMGEGNIGDQQSPYKTSFERAFLKQTGEFYAMESARLLIECDAPSFLQKIERRLSEEADRAQTYLSPPTEGLLVALLEKTLITAHLSSILSHPASGLATLVQDSRIEDLQRLYRLFGRVATGHDCLKADLSKWIVEVGKTVNDGLTFVSNRGEADLKGKGKAEVEEQGIKGKKPSAEVTNEKTKAALGWVQSVLDLKDKFDTILADAFNSDKAFEKSINDAFTTFVNANMKSPEYISLFVDENLRKGLKGKTEGEVDIVLNKTIALFRFLTEKDVFEKYSNSHLAKRLVQGRSVSDDAERGMLAKFKVEAGAAFTKAAEGMMKDVKISEEMIPAFKRYQERPGAIKAGFELSVIVCGQNFWPIAKQDQSCTLPEPLLRGTESFRKYYDSVHSGRLLTFHPELGSVEVKVRFAARSHDISLSTHAMVVLALFEGLADGESLSYGIISSTTSIATADLKRTLQSIACSKYKILLKSPKGRDIDDADTFSFNSAFSCPLAKIKIQTVASKVESNEERKETDLRVDEARNLLCDACIVRVMKDRRTLNHGDLMNEVVRLLAARFQPRPAMIKLAIERSIEKEYIERDDLDRRVLRYLA